MQAMNIPDYLRRIGCQANMPLPVSLETLTTLHQHHVCHIPFENLDVFHPQSVVVERGQVVNKILYSRRGGYCFELNQLFSALLEQIGFSVTYHLGRIWRWVKFPEEVPYHTHQVNTVTINGVRYLVDVGYGPSGLIRPLVMQKDAEQIWGKRRFRYGIHHEFGHLLETWVEDEWKILYSFTDTPAYPVDYRMANFFVSHHPSQFLQNNLVCALSTPTGRKVIMDEQFKIIDDRYEERIRPIVSRQDLEALLYEHFGIELPEGIKVSGYDLIHEASTA